MVDWCTAKLLPIKIMREDYIEKDENGMLKDFKEYWVIKHMYNNNFNIFEALIREAILKE